jgi:hypothetical protein
VKRGLQVLAVLAALTGAGLFIDRHLNRPAPPPTPEEISALRKKQEELNLRIRNALVAAGEKNLGKAPKAGILLGIPETFTRSIVQQVVTGLFRETTLTLRNIRVHKTGGVKVKMLLRKKQVGEFVLDVLVHEARGTLRPGEPRIDYGKAGIKLSLPVALAEGEGRARLAFKWDSKGLAANMVCGDLDTVEEVSGKVVPEQYHVEGVFGLSTDGTAITLKPDFGELAVRLYVDPSDQAWGVVDRVVSEQRAACREVLEKVDIKKILGNLLGKGFNIKIPKKIFKPIRLPAGVSQSLDLQGVRLDLAVKTTALVVTDDRLWYGAELRATKAGAKPAAPASPSPTPR